MTPEEFVRVYRAANVNERAVAQSHFNDLCDLLGVPRPLVADPTGENYRFEKPVSKVSGGGGFADVWLRGKFGWEYKGKTKSKSLGEAYVQLLAYREDLGNPPLLVVSDISTIEVHTNFTGTAKVRKTYSLDDLLVESKRLELRNAWLNPQAFNPAHVTEEVTVAAVRDLEKVADALKARGEPDEAVAHFLVKVVFTLFAEDAHILPRQTFVQLLDAALEHPEDFQPMCGQLFALMRTGGVSMIGRIPHINGGVFTDASAPALTLPDVQTLRRTAGRDWRALNPTIFGTLFERVIDPDKRGQLGAHYTGLRDILDVVEPVVMTPLRAEWEALRADLASLAEQIEQARAAAAQGGLFTSGGLGEHLVEEAASKLKAFQRRLVGVRVLDAAMGSGNFLYVTMRLLLDLELEVRATIRALSGEKVPPLVTPHQMLGIEVNANAHEIASMVLWIGYLQWLSEHAEPLRRSPVLEALPGLENRDAVLNGDGLAEWPEAEFIVGNPPFLGEKKHRKDLGDVYVSRLRAAYTGRLPQTADLVAYWFEKAREQIEHGRTKRAGLIATNSIRQPGNRAVLEGILKTGSIFLAWPDRPWVQDGASVRVSIVGFDGGADLQKVVRRFRDERTTPEARETIEVCVPAIHADLSGGAALTDARPLPENVGRAFQGVKLVGPFIITAEQAQQWRTLPNMEPVSNVDVLRLYLDGEDLTDTVKGRWVVDFSGFTLEEASRYLVPFRHVETHVKPVRAENKRKSRRDRWWLFGETQPAMRAAIRPLQRFIATSEVAKHRVFVWVDAQAVPSGSLIVIVAEDDFTYGVVNSTLHRIWAAHLGTRMGVGNDLRYTPTTTFETYPFPKPTALQREAVARAAVYLEACRNHLRASTPPLTLTGMYNALADFRRTGVPLTEGVRSLADAHDRLDQAVAAAYGWEWPLDEDEVLEKLLTLNLERAAQEATAPAREPEVAVS